ncbi:MAG TPA: hypothetical protein VN767_25960 [Streptosporangiaceae bacterium]|jgi:hypothetical protein|nr:hypothetical protein [Streptosporangiaceae bacterium]
MHETPLGPSTSGSVVLELGPGIGALVLHTPPELDGAEIEISPVGKPQDPSGHRTHSQVRQRIIPGGIQFAAVYPGLPVGDYTVWRDKTTPALTVTIESAKVTSAKWPGL